MTPALALSPGLVLRILEPPRLPPPVTPRREGAVLRQDRSTESAELPAPGPPPVAAEALGFASHVSPWPACPDGAPWQRGEGGGGRGEVGRVCEGDAVARPACLGKPRG